MSLLEKIRVTQTFLESKGIEKPEFGLILGSGLGELADEIQDAIVIDYADIPNWGKSTVVGHAGKLVYGTLSGRKVLALQGRFHFYEGNPLEVVTFPVRIMNIFRYSEVYTVGDLLRKLDVNSLKNLRNLGKKSIDIILGFLEQNHLVFKNRGESDEYFYMRLNKLMNKKNEEND